ncbi:hypothetical protein WOLCODRAFT_157482 [Wolfiporia cocos MD-104 SS10]|uniref:F-box domain-containing protein n=1 Tax=Wolfiporia cocos (strain MD-104) TaxID=742152 RepID=A0A2H3J3H8_WOLCO|nr:hypothetical protein WOLCODRAFT_157482 [Wolfiporia cocos MD-104 SS10]
MGRDHPGRLSRQNKGKMAKADAVEQRAQEATAPQIRKNRQGALHAEAADLHGIEQSTQVKPVTRKGVEGGNMLERAREVKKPGWRHIGRVPGAPDTALTEGNPSSRIPQLPVETPRYRYWMQRNIALNNRSHVQGHARRARTQPHILEQARTVWVLGGANKGEQAPIPQLGTLAIMGAGKLPLVGHLVIQREIWKPSDSHQLIFACLSTYSSVTTLRPLDVTFPKVREFARLVCALPSLVHLKCTNVLFTNTVPRTSLAITRRPSSVRLIELVIFSIDETSSNVEANRALIDHLCYARLVTDLQIFEFYAEASSDSNRSLRNLKLSPYLRQGKDLQTDAVSDTIASVFDLARCDSLETVTFESLEKFREVSIVLKRPMYRRKTEACMQRTMSALKKDICPQLDELFFHKDYGKLRYVDFVFCTQPDRAMPDATEWASLLKAELPRLYE